LNWILRGIGLWGVADGLFLTVFPERWASWWGRWLGEMSENRPIARSIGLLEIGLSLYLLLHERTEVRA